MQVFIFPIKSIHLGLQRSIEIEMMTTKRFEKAVTKLYKAFHDDKLNPECCKQCAVGNICDNFDAWRYFTDSHGGTTLNYVGKVNEAFGKRINGYLPSELLKIESVFLSACGYSLPVTTHSMKPLKPVSKDLLFQGLEAVVGFLCKLDNLPNVMDCSSLFDYVPKNTQILEKH